MLQDKFRWPAEDLAEAAAYLADFTLRVHTTRPSMPSRKIPTTTECSNARSPGARPTSSQATLTARSYSIGPGLSAGNLEGAACAATSRMISGACHPFYSDQVPIINQFPNVADRRLRFS